MGLCAESNDYLTKYWPQKVKIDFRTFLAYLKFLFQVSKSNSLKSGPEELMWPIVYLNLFCIQFLLSPCVLT